MYIAVSLILAFVFAMVFNRSISRHSFVWYGIAVVCVILEWFYYSLGIRETFPQWFTAYFVNFFKRSAFPAALFVLVMGVGVLKSDWTVTRKLRKIRGELSIIACLLTLGHNLIYGETHFVNLFTNPGAMKLPHLIAGIISLVMIVIMLPLMITSFQCVRKRMNASVWKRVQRMAYVFFALLYIHVMVLFIPKADKKWLDIVVYTVVFGSYFLIKITRGTRTGLVKQC